MGDSATPQPQPHRDRALDDFLARVWRSDVQPLLTGRSAGQRAAVARLGGKTAGASGSLLDNLFGFKGRPFTRAFTVLGASFGAMLPDLWDWEVLRQRLDAEARRWVDNRVQQRAGALELIEALRLFGLDETATRDELKIAWRAASRRWHPDTVTDEAQRAEHHTRFIAYQAAYERLCAAFDAGSLPRTRPA